MSKQPGFTAELLKLCGQMRDQQIAPQEAQRLSDMLKQSKSARQFYLKFMSITAALETGQSESRPNHSTDASDTDVHLLLDLLEMEQNAPVENIAAVQTPQTIHLSTKKPATQPLSDLLDKSLLFYAARQAMRSKPAMWLAAAAVLTLGVLLAMQFIGPDATQDPAPIVDSTTTKPTESAPPILPDHPGTAPVATITATHNAVWASPQAEGALAPGSKLHPNDRLTLTAGFAEITTAQGAVAILQASATIEFTHNDNALRLHAGKLVGICETPSSKGFVVRTPHMDITDLGTRFGVDASQSEATTVHIYEGEVEVALPSSAGKSPAPQRLEAGQAVRASAGDSQLASIELDRSILTRAMMPTNVLAMTGIGLGKGQIDPDWRVVAVDGKPITAGGELRAHADTTPGGEGDTGPMFLKIDDALLLANERSGVFTCRSTFEVPSSFDPEIHQLVVQVEGDHSVRAVRINGKPINIQANRTQLISVAFEQALTPGRQQIEIDIQEVKNNKPIRSGLRVKLELQRRTTTTEPDNP